MSVNPESNQDEAAILEEKAKIGFEMFKIHADQRLKFIQFFSAFYAGSFAGAVFLSSINKFFAAVIFVVLLGITALFWALENRTKELLKKSEAYMAVDPKYKAILDQFDNKENPSYSRIINIFYILTMVFSFCVAVFIVLVGG